VAENAREIECSCTDEIVCPHCGFEFADSWEFDRGQILTCDECDSKFQMEINESISYSSFKISDENRESIRKISAEEDR